jgi:uncharacterized protein YciI
VNRFLAPWIVSLCILTPLPAPCQERAEPPYEMITYYVGFLRKGPAWSAESTPEGNRIQEAHMGHIRKMVASGKLILAGPFTDNGDLRGMFVFRVDSMDEARALAEADPAVKARRLVLELHPWLSARGIQIAPGGK